MILKNTDVLILAGGFGTRLRSVTKQLPKTMAPINTQPFLFHLLSRLYEQGIRRAFISLYYLSEVIMHYFGTHFYDMELHYFIEPYPLGTGGAILFCLNQIKSKDPIFIINGDTYSVCSLQEMKKSYLKNKRKNSLLCIALTSVLKADRYNCVTIQNKRIISFHANKTQQTWINAGIYLTSPNLYKALLSLKQEIFSFEEDFLAKHCHRYLFYPFLFSGFFIDIGIPEDYYLFQKKISSCSLGLLDRKVITDTDWIK